MLTSLVIAAVVGYFLGAIPVGFLVARAHGVDIFKAGSGNPGSTNVKRVLGAKAGNLVFALDALKGALAAGWPVALFVIQNHNLPGAVFERVQIAGLVGALLGHSFSIFTHFKGGKGVATASGGLLVLMPVVILIAVTLWIVTFYASRYVSLASIVAAVSLPVSGYFHGLDRALWILTIIIALFVVIRHRSNIQRLLAGTENRFERKAKPAEGRS